MFAQSFSSISCNSGSFFTLLLLCLLPCFQMSKQYIAAKFTAALASQGSKATAEVSVK